MRIAVIIPTYNERDNIGVLLLEIIKVFMNHDILGSIIVVDDSSPDGTANVVKDLSMKFGNISVISREGKFGLGSAYKEGYTKALNLGFEAMIEMDADGSHDPSLIPDFVERLEQGFQLVIGSRYIPGGKTKNWPIGRKIISRSAAVFVRLLFKSKIHDPTSGYRCIRSDALKNLDLSKIYSAGFSFQVEMALRCEKLKLKVCEIPIIFIDRDKGKSKLSFREMLRFFKEIITLH